MKFDISSSKLFAQLQMVSSIIAQKNTISILENVIFMVKGSTLTLKAADSETMIQTSLEVENVAGGDIEVGFDAKMLLGVIGNLPEQPITFEIEQEEEAYKLTIRTQSGVYSFVGVSAENFLPYTLEGDTTSFSLPTNMLLDAINQTSFATGTDPIRPIMMGLCFDMKEDGLTVVATDAHRLAKYTNKSIKSKTPLLFVLPKKPAMLLKQLVGKYDGDISLSKDDKRVKMEFDNVVLVTRMIEGQYPNYSAVIPAEHTTKITIDKQAFVNVCKRVSVFGMQIKFSISGNEILVTTQDFDYANRGEEKIACQHEGQDITISFKANLLVEMLNIIPSDEVVMTMTDANHAGLILPSENAENEDLLMLLMPMYNND